ncbi:MAG: hypothetical protein GX968_06040, partial [Tissierellia bacterium]|nr:hypothetical protein [Tissierellia bacterium]
KLYSGINEGILVLDELESSSIAIDDTIIAIGSNQLSTIVDNEEQYNIRVGGVEAEAFKIEENGATVPNKIGIKPKGANIQFASGANQGITITRKVILGSGDNKYELENIFVYKNAISIVGSINLDGITMFPTAGEVGSVIEFTRNNFPQEKYDIYFIENLNDPSLYTEANKGKRFQFASVEGRAVISVEVPNIDTGTYHIVFTNANSQENGIVRRYVLDQQFTVIGVSAKPSIEAVQPNRAPALTPTDVEITGYLFTKPNIPGLSISGTDITEVKNVDGTLQHLDYGKGKLTLTGKEEDKIDVKVTREYRVSIGQPLAIKNFTFDPNSTSDPNTFELTTEVIDIDSEMKVDVVIDVITTMVAIDDNGNPKVDKDPITIRHKIVRSNGFTYYPSTESPEVTEVSPYTIPIEEVGTKHYLASSLDELLVSIKGRNFLVTRYIGEDGREKIRYPRIEIGGTIIDPNLDGEPGIHAGVYKPLSFDVMRGNTIVDGTEGNDVGDRIVFRLKAGHAEEQGFPIINPDGNYIRINNPIRGSKEPSNTFHRFDNMINFKIIEINEFPVIDDVRPSLVSMDGGEGITITGSNLRTGAEVYIDNEKVNNINISGDNKTITFIAPPGKQPGETQLQVINPEGGIATHPFTYTTTYTQPGLTLINPKEGTMGTLVNMRGSNFLPPDPTVVVDNINDINEFLMYRLIGTRVQMDGHDINQYNIGSNGQIELTPFTSDSGKNPKDSIFITDNNEITLGDSFDNVILYDEVNNKFYRIHRNIQNQYSIEDGLGNRYDIRIRNGKIQSIRGSNIYDLDQSTKGILELKDSNNNTYKTLKAYTPFLIEEKDGFHKITGNRVQFIDSSTLLFEVPNLSRSPWTGAGLYDVTVVNPDTKSVTLKDAFNYYSLPRTTPKVIDMVPEEGPESGGNRLRLYAPDEE